LIWDSESILKVVMKYDKYKNRKLIKWLLKIRWTVLNRWSKLLCIKSLADRWKNVLWHLLYILITVLKTALTPPEYCFLCFQSFWENKEMHKKYIFMLDFNYNSGSQKCDLSQFYRIFRLDKFPVRPLLD